MSYHFAGLYVRNLVVDRSTVKLFFGVVEQFGWKLIIHTIVTYIGSIPKKNFSDCVVKLMVSLQAVEGCGTFLVYLFCLFCTNI